MLSTLRPFTVYVEPELLAALKVAAAREGRSLSKYMARVLDEHMAAGYSGEKLAEGSSHGEETISAP
jgi:hypothetical protein